MRTLLFLSMFVLLFAASCDDPQSSPDEGDVGGACLPDDSCNGDLICVQGICEEAQDTCGNSTIEDGEECDGAALGENTCATFGYSGGDLACSSTCQFDFAQCEGGCGNGIVDPGEECDGEDLAGATCEEFGHRGGSLRCSPQCTYIEASCMPQISRINTNVDLLFVVDNSLSMQEEQMNLVTNFSTLLQTLQEGMGYMPNLHVGVTTSDMGTGSYVIPSCENPTMGRLIKGQGSLCNNPMGQNYIVDVEPKGCTIDRDQAGQCSTDCAQANCDQSAFIDANGNPTEPSGLQLVTDDAGCPRCVNYSGESLDEVFTCVANVGLNGCGFEQPLAAMEAALTAGHQENEGFLRETAYLSVVIVSDEDDCSASTEDLFNPDESTLAPLNSFRCVRYGIECQEAWDTLDGTTVTSAQFNSCVSMDPANPDSLLNDVAHYTSLLSSVKGSSALANVSAIAGPYNGVLPMEHDAMGNWKVSPTCSSAAGDGMPGVRLREMVSYYHDPANMDWAFLPICYPDYSPVLQGVGSQVVTVMGN